MLQSCFWNLVKSKVSVPYNFSNLLRGGGGRLLSDEFADRVGGQIVARHSISPCPASAAERGVVADGTFSLSIREVSDFV